MKYRSRADAAARLVPTLKAATFQTLIGLLAALFILPEVYGYEND